MRYPTCFFLLLLLAVSINCSSVINPTQPSNPDSHSNNQICVGVSDRFPDGTPAGGFGVMGIFTLDINSANLSVELIPVRSSNLTDTLEVVDITNFLTMAPYNNCAKIDSISLDINSNIVVSIGIKHPFGIGDPLKPISGRNRGDIHVFNVEGIVAAQDDSTSNFPTIGKTIAASKLLNASGYTPYLDAVLDNAVFQTDADIHPYILHFADYSSGNFDRSNPMGFESVTNPPPCGNLVMAMGCDYDYRDYVFAPDANKMTMTFAIGCTYAISSASKSQRFSPEYRIPQHLKKAASEVKIIPLTGALSENEPLNEISLQI